MPPVTDNLGRIQVLASFLHDALHMQSLMGLARENQVVGSLLHAEAISL